jgi:hypothetical protein
MNYLKPRQRASDKRWDYTQMNDGRVWPIGYCAGFREYTPEQRKAFLMNDNWYAKYEANRAKYHEDGHATSEEACECYKQHELDESLHFDVDSHSKQKCEVCEEWTEKRAMVGGYRHFVLCEKHANREEVEKLYTVGESWES